MTRLITIAHLSDLHLGPIARPAPWQLMNKRVLGYLNWVRHRRSPLGQALLERLVGDVKAQNPDHIALTGDFVNVALPAEFHTAAKWLTDRFDPNRTMAVLGNHDAYVPGGRAAAQRWFGAYLTGTEALDCPVRLVGDVALVGVNTAVATGPLIASGKVGQVQRDRLARTLARLGARRKVVLIHHPPHRALGGWRRGIDDCEELRAVMDEGGVSLVLHGHNHRRSTITLPNGAPILGVESASSDGSRYPLAAYSLITLQPEGGIVVTARGADHPDGPVLTRVSSQFGA